MSPDKAAAVQNGSRCALWGSDVASDSLAQCVDDEDEDEDDDVVRMDPLSVT